MATVGKKQGFVLHGSATTLTEHAKLAGTGTIMEVRGELNTNISIYDFISDNVIG
jgi:hypothetical protein